MGSETNIFISWSGNQSLCVAETLRSWLPLIIEGPNLWISSRDLPEGKRWISELAQKLEASDFGILIVTPQNKTSPWLLFEAGALSKNLKEGKVIPYLVALKKSELKGPLAQFQALTSDKDGTYRLVKIINSTRPNPLNEEIITKRFNKFWHELSDSLDSIIYNIKRAPKLDKEGNDLVTSNKNSIEKLYRELAEVSNMIRQIVNNWGISVSIAKGKSIVSADNPMPCQNFILQ